MRLLAAATAVLISTSLAAAPPARAVEVFSAGTSSNEKALNVVGDRLAAIEALPARLGLRYLGPAQVDGLEADRARRNGKQAVGIAIEMKPDIPGRTEALNLYNRDLSLVGADGTVYEQEAFGKEHHVVNGQPERLELVAFVPPTMNWAGTRIRIKLTAFEFPGYTPAEVDLPLGGGAATLAPKSQALLAAQRQKLADDWKFANVALWGMVIGFAVVGAAIGLGFATGALKPKAE